MKKSVILPVILSVLMVCVLFSGCSKQDPAQATNPSISTTSYMLTHVESGVINYSADEFQLEGSLELRSDGTAQLTYADQVVDLFHDNHNMWLANDENNLHSFSISGKVLTLQYYSETLIFLEK